MIKAFLLILSIIFLSGCVTMAEVDKNQDGTIDWYEVELSNLEQNYRRGTPYGSETIFEYPYREDYLAALNVVRDWGVNIIYRDYDKGVIFVRPALEFVREEGYNYSAPGRECGLFIKKINDKKTEVVLKTARRFPFYSRSAKAEDVFTTIEKEIQFRREISD